METIGQRFKKIRTGVNLSQEAFGSKIKMTKSGISAVENDKVFVSVDVLRTLFLNYNVNLNWLICGAGNAYNETAQQNEQLEKLVAQIVDKKMRERGL